MKFAIAATLTAVLILSPALCMALTCNLGLSHECCPKSHAITACPYDVLATAKVVKAQVVSVLAQFSDAGLIVPTLASIIQPSEGVVDGRHLYAQNRVLRI
jgi:hypothetical protein